MTVSVASQGGYVALTLDGLNVTAQAVYVAMIVPSYNPVPESLSDSATITDTADGVVQKSDAISEQMLLSDGDGIMDPAQAYDTLATDSAVITDVLPVDGPIETTMIESATISDAMVPGFPYAISDTATLDAAVLGAKMQLVELLESLTAEELEVAIARNINVVEGFRVLSDDLQLASAFVRTVAETVNLTPAWAVVLGVLVRERIAPSELLTPNTIAALLLGETARLRDVIALGLPSAITESIAITEALTALEALQVVERLGLTAAAVGVGIYARAWQDTLRISDALLRFVSGIATDDITLAETLANQLRAIAVESETVVASDTITPAWLLRVDVEENVELTAEQALAMLFQPTVAEGFDITAGYVAPDGNITTWAMNARSGAVTEYSNYAFNSFALLGNRYIAASDSGLYELLGDDDNGTSITARIVGGFMQFGGTKLSRLSAAYIAARGEGDFVLKIETADGVTYNYAVATRNMRSTKVHMGKGQRSRYFAYELISAGQDFDLDTLEFVPVVVQRRV